MEAPKIEEMLDLTRAYGGAPDEGSLPSSADLYQQMRAMLNRVPVPPITVSPDAGTAAQKYSNFDPGSIEAIMEVQPSRQKTVCRNHYSALGRSRDDVKCMVRRLANDIPRLMRDHGADAVVVRGTSGLALAFHLWMATEEFPIIVARKRGERSHDGMLNVIGERRHTTERYLFLDDFASTGNTVEGVREDMAPAVLAATLAYRRCENEDHVLHERHHIAGAPYFEYRR